MGIEDEKKPYQPTEEEMKKAQEMMSEQEIKSTKDRESTLASTEAEVAYGKNYLGGDLRILENGAVGFTEGQRGIEPEEIISIDEAISRIDESMEKEDYEVKKAERKLEEAKSSRDKAYIWKHKLEKLKEEQENK